MTHYIALLRGINVSGQKAIRMQDLQASLADLGLGNVRTYLQSGNVVFTSQQTDEIALGTAIEEKVLIDFGHEVPVLVLAAAELERVARSNPLWPATGGDERLYHCTFLFQAVSVKNFTALKLPMAADERAQLVERAVLLYCPHGYGKTKLTNNAFERLLGVKATTRNWRTVLALNALCHAT